MKPKLKLNKKEAKSETQMNVAKTETRLSEAKVEAQMTEAVACILLNALRDECAIVTSESLISLCN